MAYKLWKVKIIYYDSYDSFHDVLFTDDPIGFLHTVKERYDDYVQENILKFVWRKYNG